MEKIKKYFRKRKVICIIGTCTIVIVIASMGYFYYQNEQKQRILNSMYITFNDVQNIEYGTKDYDVQKELIKEVKNAKIKDIPKIDTSKIGEQTLQFILTQDGLEKEIEYKINIKDTKAPEIKFKKDSIELTVGDEFDSNSNIESVKDIIDGDIAFNEKALEINKKATDEYNKLNVKEIKDDTKVANTLLSEFVIEDIQDKEEKNLYLKNCYYIDGNVDTNKAAEYTIKVIAIDINGLKVEKEYKVTVKEIKQTPNNIINSDSSNRTSSNHSSGSSLPPAPSVKKGSKQDIVNTAIAQVGKTYARNTQGPNSFDCSGLIYYAYTQNGWSIPRRVSSGGTKLNSYAEIQPGDIIYMPSANHVALYIGDYQAVEALNPTQGIQITTLYFIPDDAQFIRY